MAARSHGQSTTADYKIWQQMKNRCYNPKAKNYHRYGGRGIKVCERWLMSFENFIADMGPRPSETYSIDRVNNDGNYEPANCHWIPKKDQIRNSSRVRLLTHNGETHSIAEWAAIACIQSCTLSMRLKAGRTLHQALTEPVMERPVTFNGETHSLSEWGRRTGMSVGGIRRRLDEGWPVELALTVPPDKIRDRYGRYTEKPPVPTHSSTP